MSEQIERPESVTAADISRIRDRLHALPKWWKDRELNERVNGFTGALNDLDHAHAAFDMEDQKEAVSRYMRAVQYVEIVEDKIADWASDVEVY